MSPVHPSPGKVSRPLAYQTLLVKQLENAHLCLDQVDERLVVVEIDERPGDVLLHVLLLLQLEHVLKDGRADEGCGRAAGAARWLVRLPTKLNCC